MSNAHFYMMNIVLTTGMPKMMVWFWPYFNLNCIINYNVTASAGCSNNLIPFMGSFNAI